MAHIVPAILARSLAEIETQLSAVRGAASMVQLDVVDGVFANNSTWPYAGVGEAEFERMREGAAGLPLWEEFDFEFDLMLDDARLAREFVEIGASRLVLHVKSRHVPEALQALQETRSGAYPVAVGIALTPDQSAEALEPFAGLYDFVQIMGIVNVGFQGQPFDERALALIRAVRAQGGGTIQVDGAVREHVRALIDAGADRLVVGSAIFKAANPRQALRELEREANA